MTLVFVKERSAEGIKEALFAHRTAIYYKNFLIGRERKLVPFFQSSLSITTSGGHHNAEPLSMIHIYNHSDIPYEIRCHSKYDLDSQPLGKAVLTPHDTTTLALETLWDFPRVVDLQVIVENILTAPDQVLHTRLKILPEWEQN